MNKIANVENVVCSVETISRHPELYHYTKPAAFEGILGSQTLWCSHYRALCSLQKSNSPSMKSYVDWTASNDAPERIAEW